MTTVGKSFVAFSLALLVGAYVGAGERISGEEEVTERYEHIFFPGGLEPRENLFTGQLQVPEFVVQDVAAISGGSLVAVAYSTELSVPRGDGIFELGLGLVRDGENPQLVSSRVLTDKIPVGTEFPGNVLDLCARITEYAASPEEQGLHLNVWATLSGTGAISAASDLFFLIGADGKLSLALELADTSQHAQLGAGASRVKNSHLRLVDLNGDRTPEIAVEERSRDVDENTVSVSSSVYRLDHEQYRPVQVGPDDLAAALSDQVARQPSLERCSQIPSAQNGTET